MSNKNNPTTSDTGYKKADDALRRRAESRLCHNESARQDYCCQDSKKLAHELDVRQVELAIQNEELRQAQTEIADSRDRYQALYDFAPASYLTLDRAGIICEANLSAGELLGVERGQLLGRSLASMMTEKHADTLYQHLQQVFTREIKHGCDLTFTRRMDGKTREVPIHIDSISSANTGGDRNTCRSVVLDLSELHAAREWHRSWESRSKMLLDTAVDAIVSCDGQGRVEAFNHAAENLFGYTEEEILGENVRLLMPALHQDKHDEYIYRYVVTGQARMIGRPRREVTGVKKDGTTFALELGIGQWWDHGECKFTAILHDITERKQAEAALRESAERYAAIFERSPVAIALTTIPEGVLLEVNEAFLQLFEYTRSEILTKTNVIFNIVAFQDATKITRALGEGRLLRNVECSATTKFSKNLVVAICLNEVSIAGQPHILITIRDVTEHRRAAQKLRESEARFRQIAEHVKDVLALHERRERRITYVSPAFETVWGRSAADLHDNGERWTAWVHPDDRESAVRAYEEMLKGQLLDDVYRIIRPDGYVRWVHARSFPIKEADGTVLQDVLVIQDTTNEHELEAELRQAQKMEAVGALASGVAHDFNNMLQAILGCVNMARDRRISSNEADAYLERAASAAKRGGDLARKMMAFTRKQEVEPKILDIDAVITGLAPLLERLVTEQVTVQLSTETQGRAVLADAIQIEQILMNLAANARDAMPEGGFLRIHTQKADWDGSVALRYAPKKPGSYVCLTVEDTGRGMEERVRLRIFEPFFTTKEGGKGTGLGLSTVFAITKQLGGHIDVNSKRGRGTTFAIYLPSHEGATPSPNSAGPETTRFHGTVLLVEDQGLVRMTVRHYLEKLGMNVVEAQSGAEALEICAAHTNPFDLLVSDVVLPIMRGPRLAELLRRRYANLRILFISANPQCDEEEKTLAGAVSVLQKPFGEEELLRKLQELLPDLTTSSQDDTVDK